jgi:peptidyl-prolyl cis-trans isomerase D
VAAHEMEKRTAKLSSFPVRSESIATPDDATIDSFFTENKASYDAPRLRSAKIGSLSAAIIAKEITISDSEIRAAFDDRLDEFSTPETRSIRQMVFDDAASANAALNRLNNGEGFAAVAASMLEWTDADTNLGTVTEANLDGSLVGPAFAAEAGAVVGPVQTAFGFHLLSIDTITAGGVTDLDDVREQIISALRGEQAINLLYDRVNMLEDALGSGATIEEAINKAGGRLDIATDIDRQGQTIDSMPAAGQVGELLQDGAILELIWDSVPNEVSVIQEGSDDMFFVVNVSTETEPRERRLDEVRAQVISDYKRVEAVKSARAAAEVVAATDDGDQDTAPVSAFRRNGIGLDHEAAGLIARAAFEQNSGDIQVIETGREAIAVRTIDIIPATDQELKDTSDLVLSVMNSALRDDLTNLLLVSLSKKHDLQLNVPAVQQILIGNAQ